MKLLAFLFGCAASAYLGYTRGCHDQTVIASCIATLLALIIVPSSKGKRQPVSGAVFITGCDSGMGEITALHLSKKGYTVFAGVFQEDNGKKLQEKAKQENGAECGSHDRIIPVKLDVTKQEVINAAVETVRAEIKARNIEPGLTGVLNFAGLGYIGPAEIFHIDLYRHQLEVNLIGYIAVIQSFLPLVREACSKPGARRGRIVLTGTGGGVPSACPPLLSMYMASKWGAEAFCQSLRLELQIMKRPIDVCMINPGFIKPTKLVEVGLALINKMWSKAPAGAKDEYGFMIDQFIKFSEMQPGTHPIHIAYAAEEAMGADTPRLRYKVGFDSKASPIVGVIPTAWREAMLLKSMGFK